MSGFVPIVPFDNCSQDEKLRRLRVLYSLGRLPIEEFEQRVEEALAEGDA